MRINTNITALNTFNSYTAANNKIAGSVAKLSSGYAINSAADNAAGLAISEKMRAQIRGLDKAASNGQDAISLVQTAEGALEAADEILQRMREIAVQSSSDTNEDEIDRDALQAEFEQLQAELDEIAEDSTFNNQNLLDGSLSTKNLAVGSATSLSGSGMNVSVGNAKAGIYNFNVSVVTTQESVSAAAPTTAASSFATSTLKSEFSDASVEIGANAESSSLLNGNYELSATYDNETETITVTAAGDNDQSFSIDLTDADLAAITASSTIDLEFETSSGAEDTFKVTLTAGETLIADADATTSELSALADAIGGSFTVAGGKDAVEEQTAVMAHLTGAESVELKAGMDSVTFGNGITVSFEELTAASLNTTATGGTTTTTYANTASVGAVGGFASSSITSPSLSNTSDLTSVAAPTYSGGTLTWGSFTGSVSAVTSGNDTTIAMTDGTNSFTLSLGAATADMTADEIGAAVVTAGISISSTSSTSTTGGSYAFEDVFGTADSEGVSSSTIEVASEVNDGLTIQVGANSGDELSINIECASAEYLGVKGLSVGTQETASTAIDTVNDALNQVSSQRAYLGAIENRLDYKIDNLETSSQNLTSAESSIRDVDMAAEMTKFTNANILSQAATAMLAQANSLPQNVLSLLG